MVLFCGGGCLPRVSLRRRRLTHNTQQLWLEEPNHSSSDVASAVVGGTSAGTEAASVTAAAVVTAAAATTRISSSSLSSQAVVGPPSYRMVASRSSCPLLEACWNQDWSSVVRRLSSHPHEAFRQTRPNRRTALHLCTMPGANCPVFVLERLLQVNPHAILVRDAHQHGGTPLHFVCGSNHRNDPAIIQRFVDAALLVEQLYYSRDGSWNLPFNAYNGYSPLYMACKKLAPAATLQILVDTRRRRGISQIGNPSPYCRSHHHTGSGVITSNPTDAQGSVPTWIAPWTGGESADDAVGNYHGNLFRSPLRELWRGVWKELVGLEHDEFTLDQLRKSTPDLWWLSSTTAEPTVAVVDQARSSDAVPLTPTIEAWIRCCVLLRPHVQSPDCIAHAVASLKCPIFELFELACRLYPHQLVQPDQNGRIPLHLILLRSRHSLGGNDPSVFGFDSSRSNTEPTHFEAHVQAALSVRPDCAEIVEPNEGLPPAALAASHGASLSVVYALVRAYPLMVASAQERGTMRHSECAAPPSGVR